MTRQVNRDDQLKLNPHENIQDVIMALKTHSRSTCLQFEKENFPTSLFFLHFFFKSKTVKFSFKGQTVRFGLQEHKYNFFSVYFTISIEFFYTAVSTNPTNLHAWCIGVAMYRFITYWLARSIYVD
jgi:hypothetical protein